MCGCAAVPPTTVGCRGDGDSWCAGLSDCLNQKSELMRWRMPSSIHAVWKWCCSMFRKRVWCCYCPSLWCFFRSIIMSCCWLWPLTLLMLCCCKPCSQSVTDPGPASWRGPMGSDFPFDAFLAFDLGWNSLLTVGGWTSPFLGKVTDLVNLVDVKPLQCKTSLCVWML